MTDRQESLKRGVSVVVPVYNSEGTLVELADRLERVFRASSLEFEVILVNDGSRDGSWEVIRELVNSRSFVRGVSLMRNYGQHNALLCGIRLADFDTCVTMDDDLQNPPEEIPALLGELRRYDVVYGKPERQKHGLYRNLASTITKLVLRQAMGAETAANISAFRAFPTSLRDAFESYRSPLVSIDVLLTWATSRFSAISVRHDKRKSGVSNYTMRRLVLHALNMMTGFSTLPLRLATIVGFSFTLFGMGVFAYAVGRYLIQGTTVPGFPFLASVIAIFSGAQLFALGIVGEYLGRMHMRMMDQPTYSVGALEEPAD
jgi:undecaprenyl-phosphate 4-deoxy-4-formamido-L-arabinose transferase